MNTCDIGLIGLAVMGENLVLNILVGGVDTTQSGSSATATRSA